MADLLEKKKANYGYFYLHDGQYYLKNYDYRLAFCLRGNMWVAVDFDFVGPYDFKTMELLDGWKSLEDEEAKKLLGDLLPEPDIFVKTDLEKRKNYLAHLEELSKTTPRKVIGWISDYSLSTVKEAEDEDSSHYAAFFAYIKENGYSFSGEQYQNLDAEPLFDDYTYLSFSRRGFGYLMALAHGNVGRYDYAGFTEFLTDNDLATPRVSALKETPIASDIELSPSQREIYEKEVEPLIEKGESAKIILTAEVRKDLYYWPEGVIGIQGDVYQFEKVALVKDEADLKTLLEGIEEGKKPVYLDDLNAPRAYPYVLLVCIA